MELYSISINGKIIKVINDDITEETTQAIVNPANTYLKHGGGVAGAIVSKGGYIIQEESDKIGYVQTGSCAITSAGKLKTRYIIHAVGPVWEGGSHNEGTLLKKAVLCALKLAKEHNLTSIAIPAISTGIFGFPKELGVKIITDAVVEFLLTNDLPKEIHFTNIDSFTCNLFVSCLKSLNVN